MLNACKRKRPIHVLNLIIILAMFLNVAHAEQTFEDVSKEVGLEHLNGYRPAVWGDYDNDGWADLYVGGHLYRNQGGVKFIEVTSKGSPSPVLPYIKDESGVWGDYDNDGYPDLYCWRTGKLFHNLKGKRFEDMTDKLPERAMQSSIGATWGDFDGDGFIDLYVGGYEEPNYQPDAIWRNNGDGTFSEVWRTTKRNQPSRGITTADFDEDGDLDIYVSNYRLEPNLLWRNKGNGVFENVAIEYGVAGDRQSGWYGHTIGSCWGDLDNDGHLDLFVGNFSHPAAYQDRPKFLKNLGPEGKFHFEDKSKKVGLRWQESYASPALGDYDNDGDLDLLFTAVYSGDGTVLYRNDGDWTFTEVTTEAGIIPQTTGKAAWADFDNDGDLDLVSGSKLYRNRGNDNNWLRVRVQGGGKVNRSAIGTQIRIRLGEKIITRQVEATTGEGNQNEATLHFGLGKHNKSVKLEIRWPDGTTQEMTATPNTLVLLNKK